MAEEPVPAPGSVARSQPDRLREWHRTRPSWMARIVWGLYAVLGGLWFVLALRMWGNLNDLAIAAGMMNAAQVTIGLLLIAVSAATSLAEERAGEPGSLAVHALVDARDPGGEVVGRVPVGCPTSRSGQRQRRRSSPATAGRGSPGCCCPCSCWLSAR